MNNKERKLRLTLKVNATFSLVSGLIAIIFKVRIAKVMGIDVPDILLCLGIGLILFGLYVFIHGFRKILHSRAIKFIIFQDRLWVIGSVAITVFRVSDLSAIGYVIVMVIAVIVAGFAIFQRKYLRQFDERG